MKLYAVTSFGDGEFYTDFYMADNHDHAEEQAKDENPPEYVIQVSVRVPFHMIERAYLIESRRLRKGGE